MIWSGSVDRGNTAMGAAGSQLSSAEMKGAEPGKGGSVEVAGAAGESPPKCKACCACPETKRVRDACIVENGQENCTQLIEAHKECMRKMGFNI